MKDFFSKAAQGVSIAAGSWQASVIAATIIIVWICGGFYFGFSNQLYQLFINSLTTVITFLMVFLIQHTQNKDTAAIQAKLNELIRVTKDARDNLISIEDQSEERLKEVKEEFACDEDGVRKQPES